jgi:hypothetical protein
MFSLAVSNEIVSAINVLGNHRYVIYLAISVTRQCNIEGQDDYEA